MKKFEIIMRFAAVWMLVFVCGASAAQERKVSAGNHYATEGNPSDSVRVSVLTCMPGPVIYELNGHSAIRVQNARGDSIWNYGLFSFDRPHFVYRFVKGETDYQVGAYPTAFFLPEYRERGSRVYEQELLLTPEEKQKLIKLLHEDLKPENRVYRYNYIKDNCATRIRDHIEAAAGGLVYTDTLHYGTYRKEMRAHHANYPWYQFGIDLALGSGLDGKITSRDEMFAPDEMMRRLSTARRHNGSPIAAPATVLSEGSDAAIDGPTPWYLSPVFVGFLVLFTSVLIVVCGIRRRKILNWWYAFYFAVIGLGGCLIAFLVFISSHEATSPNMLLFWLNPFQLIIPVCILIRKWRPAVKAMMWYNTVVVGLLLLLWIFGRQSANPAVFPLMASAPLLGFGYNYITSVEPSTESHLKNSGKAGAPKSGRTGISKKRKARK